jgi:hypothetical protein
MRYSTLSFGVGFFIWDTDLAPGFYIHVFKRAEKVQLLQDFITLVKASTQG